MRTGRSLVILLAVWLIASGAAAQEDAVTVSSAGLQIQEQTGDIRFEGNVIVRMSGAVLKCDLLTVHAGSPDLSRIVSGKATGSVVLTREGDTITAGEAEFDIDTGEVKFFGTPRLFREDTTIEAEKIIYTMREGSASFTGPVKAYFRKAGE